MDFAIRTTDVPFCQYCKVKIRDKGYQSLVNVGKTKLSTHDILEIFKPTRKRTRAELDVEENEISEEDQRLLHKAYLLTKSVPRQSNRTKWREAPGYQPNLLVEQEGNYRLVTGDMVFARGLEEELLFFLVKKSMQLDGKTDSVIVCQVGQSDKKRIPLNKLLLDRGSIAVVPEKLFKITNGNVVFDELVYELISSFNNSDLAKERSDEEWSVLLETDPNTEVGTFTRCPLHENAVEEVVDAQMEVDMEVEDEEPVIRKRKTTSKQISDDDEDDDDDNESDAAADDDNEDRYAAPDEDDDDDDDDDVYKNSVDDADRSDPASVEEDEPRLKKRKMTVHDSPESNQDDDVRFLKHSAGCDDWVALIYDGTAYLGQVLAVDAVEGYKVKTMVNDHTNFFMWSTEKESIWYRRISFVVDAPFPANNRGAYRFSDSDYKKFKNL